MNGTELADTLHVWKINYAPHMDLHGLRVFWSHGAPTGCALAPDRQTKRANMTDAEIIALARFGAACLIASREELCDLDAGWLQDVAEATGCLEPEKQGEPCADYCRCADEADSFQTQCLRVPDRLWKRAVSLDAGEETTR